VAITGESAPVIPPNSGGDRSAVTGGTKVLSDRIVVRITAERGHTFFGSDDHPVEGAQTAEDAKRDRSDDSVGRAHHPSSFRWWCPLRPSASTRGHAVSGHPGRPLVCLIPTTIGALLSAIGIAGMDRLVQRNVLAMSGRAVEAAGDVQTLLLEQDGHDHARQPDGGRTSTPSVRMMSGTWPTLPNWRRWPTRPRGSLHRRIG